MAELADDLLVISPKHTTSKEGDSSWLKTVLVVSHPRSQLYSPDASRLRIPLKYIDRLRCTDIDLDGSDQDSEYLMWL